MSSLELPLIYFPSRTAVGTGIQTATIGTEHTLQDTSAAGIYQLEIDSVNMAAVDVLELRIYVMILTSGTRRVAYFQTISGLSFADDTIVRSTIVPTELSDSGAVRATLKQTAGTGRDFPWKLMKNVRP